MSSSSSHGDNIHDNSNNDVKRLVDSHENLFVLYRPHAKMKQMELWEDRIFLWDLVTLLIATSLGGIIASALRQPSTLGYMVAGSLVGPGGVGLIQSLVQVETFAKLGLVLLLFALGVEFSTNSVRGKRGYYPIWATVLIAVVMTVVSSLLGGIWWSGEWGFGAFLGSFLSMSSTAVVLKCLVDFRQDKTAFGQVTLFMLITQVRCRFFSGPYYSL